MTVFVLNICFFHICTHVLYYAYFAIFFRMKVPFSSNTYLLDNSQCYEVEIVILEKDFKDKVNFEAPWNKIFNPCIIKGETHN